MGRVTLSLTFVLVAVAFACESSEGKSDAASRSAGGASGGEAETGGLGGAGARGGSKGGGGAPGVGGTSSGGTPSSTGGASNGGSATGGASNGGSATGGASNGGSATGGASNGGSATGGTSNGGLTGNGGTSTAGSTGNGGTSTAGSTGNGGTSTAGSTGNGGKAGSGSAGKGGSGGSTAGSTGTGGKAGSGGGGKGGGSTFTTDFNLTQSPISEGGAWRQLGLDWTRVVTANGFAFGTQTGSAGYDDSYAYLSGTWPANQSATAVIHLEAGVTRYAEVEILLRWRDSEHTSTGYECNLAFNGEYAEIIRWPGPRGTAQSQYTYVARGSVPEGVRDGDVFQADVIGNVITTRLNGRVLVTGTDTALPSGGAPGIGFFWDGSAASQKYGFTRFSATGL